ncbi:hypothetical protein OG521_01250 [Streptomyces sp. NBC_01463]|uniref:hypothetical protein n=1 Tax=Streptomyces sp. NPDC050392 TaxID=3155782 RepID=UPI00324F1C85
MTPPLRPRRRKSGVPRDERERPAPGVSAGAGGVAAGRDIKGSALGDNSRVTYVEKQYVVPPGASVRWAGARGRGALLVGMFASLCVVALVGVQQGWLPRAGGASGAAASASTAPPHAAVSTSPEAKIDNSGGWGPGRKTFTMQKPASYPVFNSITDNRVHGDERNFVQCRDKQDGNERYADQVIANDGHHYRCYFFFNNDITPAFDTRVVDGKEYPNPAAALQGSRARVLLPPEALYNPAVRGLLSAENSITVWDSCNFVAPRRIRFTYVPGSARMHVKGVANGGVPLKETQEAGVMKSGLTVAPGALLGDRQDGFLYQNGGFLIFEIKVAYAS